MATAKSRSRSAEPRINLNVLALVGMVIIGILAIVAMNGHFKGEFKSGDVNVETYRQR